VDRLQIDTQAHVAELNISQHPSVDLMMYETNAQAQAATCANNSGCGSGQQCVLGVCVRSSWTDRSQPANYNPGRGDLPGTIEARKYRPGGAKYDGYISTSIKGVPTSP
jgi:hypothetical protein